MQNKIPFRTPYGEKKRINCPSGTGKRPIWEYEIDARGRKKLAITGEQNIYEEIQAEAESVKIENILQKVAIGDMSDFRPDGIYQDVTQIPNNLIQAKQEMQKIENLWRNLPTDIKAKYNWDVNEYMGKAGEKAWLIDTGFLKPETTNTTDETITSENLKVDTKTEVPENE